MGARGAARVQGTGGINFREVPHAGYQAIGETPLKLLPCMRSGTWHSIFRECGALESSGSAGALGDPKLDAWVLYSVNGADCGEPATLLIVVGQAIFAVVIGE
jgi:hypothetical protein